MLTCSIWSFVAILAQRFANVAVMPDYREVSSLYPTPTSNPNPSPTWSLHPTPAHQVVSFI